MDGLWHSLTQEQDRAGRGWPPLRPARERAKDIMYGAKRYYLTLKKWNDKMLIVTTPAAKRPPPPWKGGKSQAYFLYFHNESIFERKNKKHRHLSSFRIRLIKSIKYRNPMDLPAVWKRMKGSICGYGMGLLYLGGLYRRWIKLCFGREQTHGDKCNKE